MKNRLKEHLLSGKTAYGPFIVTSGLDSTELIARVGYDFLMIDAEHGSMGFETTHHMVSLIRAGGAAPLIRVEENRPAVIKRALDAGVDGIMIPMVNSAEDARRAVSYCKYPPLGIRGTGAGHASQFLTEIDSYIADANKEILVIVQIEHKDAVEHLDEILSVPGVDMAFVGTYDLSMSYGIPAQTNDPIIWAALEKVVDSCRRHNVIPAVITSKAQLQRHYEMGFRMLLGGMDSFFIRDAARDNLESYRAVAGRDAE